jgi:glycosyltransferase involved in cell wall biosynthesis
MDKLKIFQFSFGDGYAGSAKVAILSSKLLAEKGHNVTLFASKGSLTEKRAKDSGLNVIALDSAMEFKMLIHQIAEIFTKEKPAFVITHHSLDRKVGFKLKSKFGKSFYNIGYRHNISKSFPVIGPLMYNWYYDALIACSGGVAESLIKSGIRKNKVKTIYNGISVPDNLQQVNGDKVINELKLNNKIVLGLSTWFHKERKGFDILFNAFSGLDEKYTLLLAGIPESGKNEVEKYASEFGIKAERLIMPGYVENIWEYYKAMDIFLLPSRSEGFSLALLEAGAAGLPLIVSDIPGNNEFIRHGINGFMFNINEPELLKKYILDVSGDPKLSERLSSQAHEDVMKNYLISHYADNLEEYLLSFAGRK